MLLCNEYRTAYKQVADPEAADRLLKAGWQEVEPVPPPPPITDAPHITCHDPDPLKYKGRYLSWYVQSGTVQDLRAALTHCGIAHDPHALKATLRAQLRQYLRLIKQEQKEEAALDRT